MHWVDSLLSSTGWATCRIPACEKLNQSVVLKYWHVAHDHHVLILSRNSEWSDLGHTNVPAALCFPVVPHITDAIQEWVVKQAKVPVDGDETEPQVCVIEVSSAVCSFWVLLQGFWWLFLPTELKSLLGGSTLISVCVCSLEEPSATLRACPSSRRSGSSSLKWRGRTSVTSTSVWYHR